MLKRFCVCHHHHHRHDHHDHCQHYHRHHWHWWPAPVLTVFSSFTTTQHKLLPSPTTFLNSTKLAQTQKCRKQNRQHKLLLSLNSLDAQCSISAVQANITTIYYNYYFKLLSKSNCTVNIMQMQN